MVKVGDKIRILLDGADYANVQRGDEFVVSEVFDEEYVQVAGKYHWIFSSCSYEVIHATPPQKITKNGYEYSLVGPVKPDWLVDGAWVVDKETGILYRIMVVSGRFICVDKTRLGERRDLDYITSNFRPHAPSDWKWGDWAMYDGKKVFVVKAESKTQHAMISCAHYPTGRWIR